MQYIKDNSGKVVLAFDGNNLYFNSQEQDSDSDSEMDESISLEKLRLVNNGGLKLNTILEYQKELAIISDTKDILKKIISSIPHLSEILVQHEKACKSINRRIVLLEREFSGPAFSGRIRLCLDGHDMFDLYSSTKGNLSASERIEYYGLDSNDYWDQIQATGEFFEHTISKIKTARELHEGIITILTKAEQWNMKEDEIEWKIIIDALLSNKATCKMGIELQSISTND